MSEAVAGLVLAAGAGTRFGDSPKLLAELRGRPLLEWAVRAQCDVPAISRVVVVLGARADEVLARVDFGRAETVVCEDWETGQAASLRTGLAALAGAGAGLGGGAGARAGAGVGAGKVIVTLGDHPLVTPAVIARFVEEPPLTRAVYDGRPGHPVVLGAAQISELMTLRGDHGARDLLRGGPVIEAAHLCSGRDVDTPDDLEAVRDEARTVI